MSQESRSRAFKVDVSIEVDEFGAVNVDVKCEGEQRVCQAVKAGLGFVTQFINLVNMIMSMRMSREEEIEEE